MSASNILWYLEKLEIFQNLSKESLNQLGAITRMTKFNRSDAIFMPDTLSENTYILKQGKVKISSYNQEGNELIKTILKPGEMFGKFPYFNSESITDYAVAIEDCTICQIPSSAFEKLISTNSELSIEVMKFAGQRLHRLERRVEMLSFKNVKSRLIELLLDFNTEFGKKVGMEHFIEQSLSHREIASLIATSRQTVTKLLNELRERELIDFNRRRIIIRNLDALKSEALVQVA